MIKTFLTLKAPRSFILHMGVTPPNQEEAMEVESLDELDYAIRMVAKAGKPSRIIIYRPTRDNAMLDALIDLVGSMLHLKLNVRPEMAYPKEVKSSPQTGSEAPASPFDKSGIGQAIFDMLNAKLASSKKACDCTNCQKERQTSPVSPDEDKQGEDKQDEQPEVEVHVIEINSKDHPDIAKLLETIRTQAKGTKQDQPANN